MVDLLGFGHCCADYLSLLKPFPAKGKKGEVVQSLTIGGGPVPTACQFVTSLGKSTRFVGKVGVDDDGRYVLEGLRSSGVDASGMVIDSSVKTTRASIWIDAEDGSRTVALDTTNYSFPTLDDFDTTLIGDCRFFEVDGRPTEATIAGLREARRLGVSTMLDAGAVRPRISEMLPLLDYAVVSSDFADTFSPGSDAQNLATRLIDAGARIAVVTVGEAGAYWNNGIKAGFVEGFRISGVVDTTGAGDIFHGGLIYAILEGWDLESSLRFANAAAALSTRRLSGRMGIPARSEIDEILRQG